MSQNMPSTDQLMSRIGTIGFLVGCIGTVIFLGGIFTDGNTDGLIIGGGLAAFVGFGIKFLITGSIKATS